MMNWQYVLDDDGKPLPMPDLVAWGQWMAHTPNRIVARTDISDDVFVSTIFLGLNQNSFNVAAPPVLWETMIFGGKHTHYQQRYTNREDALKGHALAVELASENEDRH